VLVSGTRPGLLLVGAREPVADLGFDAGPGAAGRVLERDACLAKASRHATWHGIGRPDERGDGLGSYAAGSREANPPDSPLPLGARPAHFAELWPTAAPLGIGRSDDQAVRAASSGECAPVFSG
jgi:hypothetical protein